MAGIQDLILRGGGGGQSTRVVQPGAINTAGVSSKAGGAVNALVQILTALDATAKNQRQIQQFQNISRVLGGQQPQQPRVGGVSGAVNNVLNKVLGGGTQQITQGSTGVGGVPPAAAGLGVNSAQQLVNQMLQAGFNTGNPNVIQSAVNASQILNQARPRVGQGTAKSFVDSGGNFVGSFIPGREPRGTIPLDVFKAQQAQGVKATRSLADDFAELSTSKSPEDRKRAEEMLRFKRASPTEAGDKKLFSTIVTKLPELKQKAFKSNKSIDRIGKMIDLVDTGQVTGKGGQIRAGLAGWAEALGVSEKKLKGMSDAQLFQRLGRLIVGPMRLDIVGPGPVTDFEQGILDKMAGGGGLASGAAKELLETYIDIANDNIELFNTSVDSAADLNPSTRLAFRKIVSKPRTGVTGRPLVPTRNRAELEARREELRKQKFGLSNINTGNTP